VEKEEVMRNANLQDLHELLKEEHARKVDVVVPATALRAKNGSIVVQGAEMELTPDGFYPTDGTYLPTDVFDESIAGKLEIGSSYLKKCRAQATDLYDTNINGWLHGRQIRRAAQAEPEVIRAADARSFLFRGFKAHTRDDEDRTHLPAVARALLSDQYAPMDNLDVLTAALGGIREAGVDARVHSCDLSDRKMYVRVVVPELTAMAPELLKGYRNPFADQAVEDARNHGWTLQSGLEAAEREGQGYGGAEPIVFAGLDFRNSEVGGAAFSISPVIIVKVCKNGLVISEETIRKVHVGSRMDAGLIDWSDDTKRKHVDLVMAQTRDAVAKFLSMGFVEKAVQRIEEKAGAPVREPEKAIKRLSKDLRFSEAETNGILDHFIRGGQLTAGGVANAITSYSQTVGSADRAHDLDDAALRALDLVAR
jgi:hypothetical protein